MNISLPTLMDLLTYSYTLSNVTLFLPQNAELLSEIEKENALTQTVYIEYLEGNRVDVWTIDGWICESKRRKEIADLSDNFKKNYKPKTIPVNKLELLQKLMNEL
jgi:hypothetical protein